MRKDNKLRSCLWILFGVLVLQSIPFVSRTARADEFRREERRDDRRIEDERRRREAERLAEERRREEIRLAEERRLHPAVVYAPAPVVVAPPPPSPGISLVIPLSFR